MHHSFMRNSVIIHYSATTSNNIVYPNLYTDFSRKVSIYFTYIAYHNVYTDYV